MSTTDGPFLTGDAAETALDELLAGYFARLDAGEPVDRDAFVAAHPEYAEALAEYFETAAEIERMAGPVQYQALPVADHLYRRPVEEATATADTHPAAASGDSVRVSPAAGDAGGGGTLPVEGDAAVGDPAADQPLPRRFGRYVIERCLGQGAMGTVYLAEDAGLGRKVALKVPKVSAGAGLELVERFYREARSAARLSHRNICPVYDVGEIGGVYYLTMAWIAGRPLKDFIHPEHLQPQRQAAAVVRKLALALDHAHRSGIVHRDLKPANIMVDPEREPVIMDFGLARAIEEPVDLRVTQSGVVVGTPGYMPPEQVEGDQARIGPASDIYSLGVILYELLTGDLPFRGSLASVMSQILTNPPTPPSLLRPELDRELESICLKMMAKRIEDRYASMREVADALGDYLRHSREGGNPAGDSARLPAFEHTETDRPVGLAGLRSRVHEQQQRAEALIRLGRHDVALRILEAMVAVDEPALAAYTRWAERELPNVREARAAAAVEREGNGPTAVLRYEPREESRATRRIAIVASAVVAGAALLAWGAAFLWNSRSGDRSAAAQPGTSAASGSPDRTGVTAIAADASQAGAAAPVEAPAAAAEQPADPRQVLQIDAPDILVSVEALRDGGSVMTACADGHVYLWNLESGKQLQRLDAGDATLRFVAASADGRRVAAAGAGSVRVWNVDGTWAGDVQIDQPVLALGLSADGRQVFTASSNVGPRFGPRSLRTPGFPRIPSPFGDWNVIEVYDVETGQNVRGFSPFGPTSITAAAFAGDGSRAAVAGPGGRLTLFDVRSGSSREPFRGHFGLLTGMAFSGDGRRLATFGPGALSIWDAVSGGVLSSTDAIQWAGGDVTALSHDGAFLLSTGNGFTVLLWQTGRASPLAELPGHRDRVTSLAFVPGRPLAVSTSADKTLRVWRLPEQFRPSPADGADGAAGDGTSRVPVFRGD